MESIRTASEYFQSQYKAGKGGNRREMSCFVIRREATYAELQKQKAKAAEVTEGPGPSSGSAGGGPEIPGLQGRLRELQAEVGSLQGSLAFRRASVELQAVAGTGRSATR